MPAFLDCPEIECWQALLDDTVAATERECYEQHLESCPACQERLRRMEDDEDDIRRLGRQIGDPSAAPADPTLLQILGRLHEAKVLPRTGPLEPADLYFLRPAEQSGVLGLLGEYEVLEVIGQGSMGVVLKAFEPALLRMVAIKVMAPALAGSATARRRFTREAQAAAAVCHDHVVAVHGVCEADGLPYLVMQYVDGESLQDRLDRAGLLEVADIVRIGLQTASGLAAAHAQGLIHRDIKPANLLLENGVSRVKITDFGLARMVDDVGLTQNGVVAGTPEYMAPEQARGEGVDHRADLFSLGSVLYACCTGSPPFRGSTALAVLRQVSEEEPPSLRSLNPNVPAWLEAFIARLMAKDPAQRFQSATEVAALLEGYLGHLRQPNLPAPPLPFSSVSGCPKSPPRARFAWRFCRRSWVAALVSLMTLGLIASALIRFGGGVGPQAQPANEPASRPDLPGDAVDEGVWTLTFSPDGKRLVTAGGHHSRPGQLQIWDLASRKPLVTRQALQGVRSTAWSPDGNILATGHWGGDIKLRDPLTGEERTTLTGHHIGVNDLAFSADGALLASAGLDKTAILWNLKTLRERQTFLGHSDMVFSIAFFRHGRAIVTGSKDRTARIWDLDTGKERFVLRGHGGAVDTLAVSPDEKIVATGSGDRTIRLWNPESGEETAILRQNKSYVKSLSFSSDGLFLASAGSDGTVYLWDVVSRKLLQSVRQHDGIARVVAFSPDSKLLASGGGQDKTIKLWDVAAARDVATLSASGAVSVPDTPGDAELQAPSKGRWLIVAGILFAVVLLSFFGAWYLVRRSRRAASTPPSTAAILDKKAVPEPVSPAVYVQCSGCGKKLKARAALAGKKVKCPQCGIASAVPAADTYRAEKPEPRP